MRYSLAGGYQSNGENALGLNYCVKASDRYRPVQSAEAEIRKAMESLMGSPGHRQQILKPHHRMVNIGLAWDTYNFKVVQQFEGDHIEYETLPVIENNTLRVAGRTKNGATFTRSRDLRIAIFYDPPPQTLTAGQIARTYCAGLGIRVAGLRAAADANSYYLENEHTVAHKLCPDPRDMSPDLPPAQSHDDARRLWQEAYDLSQTLGKRMITVPWVDADWKVQETSFDVRANVMKVLAKHGDGVYTVVMWGTIKGETAIISQYSIFFPRDVE